MHATVETDLPAADLLPVSPRANLPFRAMRLVGSTLLRCLLRVRLTGRENLPRGRNYILVANHLGWLDWASLLMFFPAEPRIHFLADPTGLVKRPVEWWLVRVTGGYVPVDRGRQGDPALFRHVYRCLELGGAVAIFPEGDYGPEEGRLMPFRKGFAHFAINSGVPVVPVALSGTRQIWVGKSVEVVVGEPIDPAGHDVESLVAVAEERVAALLPTYREPDGPKPLKDWLTHLF